MNQKLKFSIFILGYALLLSSFVLQEVFTGRANMKIFTLSVTNGGNSTVESNFSRRRITDVTNGTVFENGTSLNMFNGDTIYFRRNNYKEVKIDFFNIIYLESIKVGLLHNSDTITQRIKGNINLLSSNSSVDSIYISCDLCGNFSVRPNSNGDYTISYTTPDSNTAPTITYRLGNKSIVLRVTPRDEDDHIHIDLAFDDGNKDIINPSR